MAEAKIQKRNTYTIYDDEGIGTVQIADEVVIFPAMEATPSTSVAASPAIIATTSSASLA